MLKIINPQKYPTTTSPRGCSLTKTAENIRKKNTVASARKMLPSRVIDANREFRLQGYGTDLKTQKHASFQDCIFLMRSITIVSCPLAAWRIRCHFLSFNRVQVMDLAPGVTGSKRMSFSPIQVTNHCCCWP